MSIEAIAAALAEVRDELLVAHHQVTVGRDRLAEAVGTLTTLERNHPGSLSPPEFREAEDRLARGLEAIVGGVAAIDEFRAKL
ncbi:MAG TPA: hypothetical protein VHW44_04260 [Pseudonocardiaceae bacterium]|jgi:hypothetical protein|nr:hypothetical protein [Pseudonocardiaceae bacterium]